MGNSSEYRPLIVDDDHEEHSTREIPNPRGRIILFAIIAAQAAFNVVLIGVGFHLYQQRGPSNPLFPQSLYSPVQDLLKYEVRSFKGGFRPEDKSIYQGPPSREVDEAWENLYINTAINKIPKSEAGRLANKTYPLLGDEDNYVFGLDVFHQVSLGQDMVRRALYPDHYRPVMGQDPENFLGFSHTDHCIDSIRQSLMCMSDVSAIVWQWNEDAGAVKIHADVAHTCRRFDLLHDWARDHFLQHEINLTVKIEDDIVIPIIQA